MEREQRRQMAKLLHEWADSVKAADDADAAMKRKVAFLLEAVHSVADSFDVDNDADMTKVLEAKALIEMCDKPIQ